MSLTRSDCAVDVRYSGRLRSGTGITGRYKGNPATLAQRLFDKGCREARLKDDDGTLVGFIGEVDGKRTWWALDTSTGTGGAT